MHTHRTGGRHTVRIPLRGGTVHTTRDECPECGSSQVWTENTDAALGICYTDGCFCKRLISEKTVVKSVTLGPSAVVQVSSD